MNKVAYHKEEIMKMAKITLHGKPGSGEVLTDLWKRTSADPERRIERNTIERPTVKDEQKNTIRGALGGAGLGAAVGAVLPKGATGRLINASAGLSLGALGGMLSGSALNKVKYNRYDKEEKRVSKANKENFAKVFNKLRDESPEEKRELLRGAYFTRS